jgi:hypothetical protein
MSTVLIIDKLRLLVAMNPKVMTTTLKTIASILALGVNHANPVLPVDRRYYLDRAAPEEQMQKLATYKRALLVRNPYTRLHSAWNNKFRTLATSQDAAAPWIPIAKQVCEHRVCYPRDHTGR